MKRPKESKCEVVDAQTPDFAGRAAAVIGVGGVVVIPTETTYGLAVDPFNEAALARLFALKKRDPAKPILVLIARPEQLQDLVAAVPEGYTRLIDSYWPGPLTLIFPGQAGLPELLTGGTGTIGIRMSSDRHAAAICRAARGPITATSANTAGDEPARTAAEAAAIFGDAVDLIVDGGAAAGGGCSTVVGCRDGRLTLVRAGAVDFAALCRL